MDHLPVHTSSEVEEADFKQVANPTNTIILPLNSTHGEAIQHLSNTIPTNEYGLPLYYIRSDMVDWTSIDSYGYLDYDQLEVACEALQYTDGFPTLRSGSPFWSPLAHEPYDAHILFKQFLALDEITGIRLLDDLSTQENVPLDHVRELSLEYFWSARARSYDLFIVAAEAKRREVRTRKTEDSHFTLAGGILEKVVNRINNNPDLIEKMDAKDLFDLFEQMVKVQRLSLGLTGAQASTNNNMPMNPGSSVEFILRRLTKDVGLSGDAQGNIQERLKLLMSDEGTAMMAQELVIRATTGNQVYDGKSGLGSVARPASDHD